MKSDLAPASSEFDGLTIGGLLDRAVRLHPDHLAYVDGDRRLSWSQTADEVDRYARALLAWGLRPGERVALWMGNTLDWVLVELAVVRLGAVLVPVNTGFTIDEASYVVGQSDAVLLVVAAELRGRALGADAVAVSQADGVDVRAVMTVGDTVAGAVSLESVLEGASKVSSAELAAIAAVVDPDDTVLTLYTSGTTGFPKGVMHSHRVIGNMTDAADRLRLQTDDCTVMYLPLFHIFALAATLTFMSRGAALVLMEVYEPGESLDLMEKEGATVVYGVGPHYLDQIRHPSFALRDLSCVRLCLSPGTADLVRLVSDNLAPAINVYGMTETTSMTSLGSVDDPLPLRAETVGRTLPRSTVKIVDEHGIEVPPGVVGELLVKGPPVMQGYYRDESATEEAVVDGWFHTGDALSIDDDGYLRFVGRINEMFKVGGENVDPIEVETVLMRHPAVAFASVQPMPDERMGAVGLAHVTALAGRTVDVEEVRVFARQHLASFKVPRSIVVVDEMPMTASGKVRKFLLRDQK